VKFEFDDVCVDADARQVLRAGAPVHVSPKAFDLLVALIRERPKVLSKEDLHARLWPSTFVSDTSLAMVVAEVRAALGETAREPRAVRTVHRHGYAFQGNVREVRQTPGGAAAGRTAMGFWLIAGSRRIPLLSGENVIGRDPAARVWLDSPSVSRRHARILVEGRNATLEDLGSKNGSRVGATRVTKTSPLADGDELTFGSVVVTFRTWAADPTLTEGGA
jgi:DNA-binding winged helix-turn-helix (wHTH) protein